MDDLIRRKDAINRIIQETEESGKSVVHINTIKRLLQDVETAYNVDAVIADIEDFREEAEQFGFASALSDIVEVVRNGGVHE